MCRRSDPFTVIRAMIADERGLTVSDIYKETGFARRPAESKGIEPEWTGDDVCLMSGCVVRSMAPFLEYAGAAALEAVGVHPCALPGERCCLHPVQFIGVPAIERRETKRRILDSAGGRRVVTLCPGCDEELSPVSEDEEHIIAFLHGRMDSLPSFPRKVRVGMEPGCSAEHLRKEMRSVLERMNCEVVNRGTGCCGKTAPVADELMEEREQECSGAEIIVVGCPMCFDRYDAREGGLPVVHIAELVAMAAGKDGSLGFHRIPVPRIA